MENEIKIKDNYGLHNPWAWSSRYIYYQTRQHSHIYFKTMWFVICVHGCLEKISFFFIRWISLYPIIYKWCNIHLIVPLNSFMFWFFFLIFLLELSRYLCFWPIWFFLLIPFIFLGRLVTTQFVCWWSLSSRLSWWDWRSENN